MGGSKVFVVIVTYNAMKWIDKCLSSLAHSEEECSIVVVDNCSNDETVSFVRSNYPHIIIIQNEQNKGFGYANNQGIEYAYKNGATNFFLLNQDAYVNKDTIGTLVDIQNRNNIAVLSPIHLNGDGLRIDRFFFEYFVVNEHNRDFVSDLLLSNIKKYYEVEFVNAAAWMISRRCVEKVGGFDPLFYIYGEDCNYCQRVHYHSESVAVTSKAIVRHDRITSGNPILYKKREVLSLLLITYANINEALLVITLRRIKFHLWMFKNSIVALMHLRWVEWWYIISGYITYVGLLPKVIKSRKNNKIEKANYLNLQD